MNRPAYLTIEGVDAVGKTTLVSALHSHYAARGTRTVIKPEFPTAPEIAAPIDEALKRSTFISEGFAGGPEAAFFFMMYAEMTAMASLPEADLVVGDRGLDSVCLYQGASVCRRDPFDAVATVAAMEALYRSLGLRVPERTLLLVLPPADLPARLTRKNGREPTNAELAQLVWLQDEFVRVASQRPRFRVLDARGDPEAVLQRAVLAIGPVAEGGHP